MRKLSIYLCTLCLFLLPALTFAGERGAFPEIGIGARPLAMGGAFVALAEGNEAIYWNPAGLSKNQNRQLAAMQTSLFGMAIPYQWLAASFPVGKFTVGASFSSLDASEAFGDFPYREQSFAATLSSDLHLAGQALGWG